MKKNGYTLAEALISLTIIGVIAALIIPMANKFRPDTTKVLFLKTYDSIVEITQELASNTKIYPLYDDDYLYEFYSLANLKEWVDSKNKSHQGNSKYCTILADAFGADNNNCSNENVLSNNNSDFTSPSFTSTLGVVFDIKTIRNITDENTKIEYQSDIYFDVDGLDKGKNCYYNFDNCTQPDRFKLLVASDGKVIASDPKSQYYLDTRVNAKLEKDLDDLSTQNRYPTREFDEVDRKKDLVKIN